MQWHKERKKEFFHRKAKREGYRARSAYKLIGLDEKYHLIHRGDVVVDLGAAPGSWSQVILKKVGKGGFLLALDVLPMANLDGNFHFLQADLFERDTSAAVEEILPRKADLVVSDVAPEFSGIRSKDMGLANELSKISFKIAKSVLREGGSFVCKIFSNAEASRLVKEIRDNFGIVKIVKPKSSLKLSSEMYIVAKNLL